LSLSSSGERANKTKSKEHDVSFDQETGFTVSERVRARWREAFPACDLGIELAQAHSWVMAKWPERRKTDWHRFVVGWLTRAQNQGGTRGAPRAVPQTKTRAQQLLEQHRRDRAEGRIK
jgi:hypothetical protein